MSKHIVNQIHNPDLVSGEKLHVLAVISNTEGYHSRYRLARDFISRMKETPHIELHVVEAALADRQHEIEESKDGLRLRVNSSAWCKENLINIGARHLLPASWRYLAWVDMDVEFRDLHWAQAALHQLQHFSLLQPWESALDLGSHGRVLQTFQSFGYLDQAGIRKQKHSKDPYGQYGHSGYAWCCTRSFWEQVGGLPDFCILGSADAHCAWGAIGDVNASIHKGMGDSYKSLLHQWQARAVKSTHKEVGFSVGRLEHHYHGNKADRKYKERWQILIDEKYDPLRDIVHDSQGVVHIVKPSLERAVRAYNRGRNEDAA